MTEDEVVGWHQQLNEHEFEQAPGDSEGQGSLVCCSPWGCKESDMTKQLSNRYYAVKKGLKIKKNRQRTKSSHHMCF